MTDLELLLAHRDFVRAIAAELVRDPASRDDVAQETLLAAWQRRGDDIREPRGFLATVARNVARQFQRGDDRRRGREEASAPRERLPSVVEVLEREERRRAVVAAVLALEEPYRVALLLRYDEGLPPRAIARRLDLPVETVRTRLKRGVEQVRARLIAARSDGARGLGAWLLPLALPTAKAAPLAAAKWIALAAAGLMVAVVSTNGTWRKWGSVADDRQDEPIDVAAVEPTAAASEDIERRREVIDDPGAASHDPAPAAVASPDPSAPKLSGLVIDARSFPVAGARVFAWPERLDAPVRLDDAIAAAERPQATTTAEGRFEIPLPSLVIESWTLFATAAERSPGIALSVLPNGAAVTIVLQEPDHLFGSVADGSGVPIGGATVRTRGMHGGAVIEHATTTAADGTYRVAAPIADRAAWGGDSESWVWWVEADAPGFAPRVVARKRNLDPEAPPAETRLDLVLLRGTTINGTIVDVESREPVADARVVVVAFEEWFHIKRHSGGTFPNPWGERIVAETRSDEAGLYRLDELPALAGRDEVDGAGMPEHLQLFVVAPGFATGFAHVPIAKEGGAIERSVELWQAATIAGRVVDADGQPVVGVHMSLYSSFDRQPGGQPTMPPPCVGDPRTPRNVFSDAAGCYEFGVVPARVGAAGRFSIGVNDQGWKLRVVEGALQSGVVVEARAGDRVVAPDFVVVRERGVWVEVVDEVGRPIAGATVTSLPNGTDSRTTDAEGRLYWCEPELFESDPKPGTLKLLPASSGFRVERAGYVSTVTATVKLSESDAPLVRVVLARGHRIEGQVVDRSREPVPRAWVWVLSRVPTEEEVQACQTLGVARHAAGPLLSSTVADALGNFRFDDLPEGRHVVRVEPPIAWRDRGRGGPALVHDVPVDGVPITVRLFDEQ